jgi:hypothetical protein
MTKKIISTLTLGFIVLFIILFSFFNTGCSCGCGGDNENVEIPLNILRKSDQFIISRTGNEFFKKYITIDFSQSKHIPPNYLMVYKFYIPEKPFVDEIIRFNVDSIGNALKQFEVVGIPECNSNPMNCDFVVDEKIARQIATENGLSKGINDWKVDFVWDANYNKYVWQLLSTIKESQSEFGYRGEGEQISIDPTNASVIDKHSWKIN